jgi:hypothetical protein
MKSVTFNHTPSTPQFTPILDMKDLVIKFLVKHGHQLAQASVSNNAEQIIIKANCANSAFTRALALLQLVFSEGAYEDNDSGCYIEYRQQYTFALNVSGNTRNWIKPFQYLERHMDITIQ